MTTFRPIVLNFRTMFRKLCTDDMQKYAGMEWTEPDRDYQASSPHKREQFTLTSHRENIRNLTMTIQDMYISDCGILANN